MTDLPHRIPEGHRLIPNREYLALLALFAVVHDCATEDSAFQPDKVKVAWGRVYRQWRQTARDMGWDGGRGA